MFSLTALLTMIVLCKLHMYVVPISYLQIENNYVYNNFCYIQRLYSTKLFTLMTKYWHGIRNYLDDNVLSK